MRPSMEYGERIIFLNLQSSNQLESIQGNTLSKIAGIPGSAPKATLRLLLEIPPIEARYDYLLLSSFHNLLFKENSTCRTLLRDELLFTQRNLNNVIKTTPYKKSKNFF
jgi:hypothetical protein